MFYEHLNKKCRVMIFIVLLFCISEVHAAIAPFVRDIKAGQTKKIVTMGTSLTALETTWVTGFTTWIKSLAPNPANVTIVNVSVAGACSYTTEFPQFPQLNGISYQLPQIITHNPDVVFIEFAINDAWPDYKISLAQSKEYLNFIIDELEALNPNVEIVLMTMNNVDGDWIPLRPDLANYYQGYRDVASTRGLILIDHYPNWLDLYNTDRATWDSYVPDDIHPTTAAAAAIIQPEIEAQLNTPPGDFDYDGDVDANDLTVLAEQWLNTCYTDTEGLVAHWKLDETGGAIAEDSIGGHDGTLVDFPIDNSQWVPGKFGGALIFDGIDDYVEIVGYKGVTGSASRTCTAWIKTPIGGSGGDILGWGNNLGNGMKWRFRVVSTGHLAIQVQGYAQTTTATVNDGQWHHVAVVLPDVPTPLINDLRLYIDGVEITDITTALGTEPINTGSDSTVRIGSQTYMGSASDYFTGQIDDVHIYDRALASDEICARADITRDGVVNLDDFAIFAIDWLFGT